MRNIWILFKREMMAYFFSPIAYIVGVCVLLLMGAGFCFVIEILRRGPSDYSPLMFFFNGFFSWIVLLLVPPVITMRLFADEKRTGTIETLMTTPLKDTEYLFAKYLAGCAFYLLLWLPTLNYVFVLRHFAHDTTPLPVGTLVGGYLGFFLVGMLFVAIGCMASALTKNQVIAAVISFAIGCGLFFFGLYFYINPAEAYRNFFEYVSLPAHMQEMSRGLVAWKRLVFSLSATAFFLFVTHRVIQARQWKS